MEVSGCVDEGATCPINLSNSLSSKLGNQLRNNTIIYVIKHVLLVSYLTQEPDITKYSIV